MHREGMEMLKEAVSLKEIGKEIEEYLSRYIIVNMIIVYGSYAYGTPREDSDIDIAVISVNFRNMSIMERIELLAGASVAIDSRIEVKGFTLEEYENAMPGSLIELIKFKS